MVTKLDRLGRSLEHLIELSKQLQNKQVDLVVLDQDPIYQLVLVEGSPKLISDDDVSFGFCDMPTALKTVRR